MNTKSKNFTSADTGINIPVRVSGFKRTWTARGRTTVSLSTTFLAANEDRGSFLNAVIFNAPNVETVEKYDKREGGYCRYNVPWKDITILRGNISDNGTFPSDSDLSQSEFWIYVILPKYSEYPDHEYPIVQSYVDVFLSGCIQLEQKYGLSNFSDECFTSTFGWDSPWVNDRLQPRRPWTYEPNFWWIDQLIAKHIPDHHKKTYIERFYHGRSDATGTFLPSFPLVITMMVLMSCHV